jgi:hypothetical protein
MVYFKEVRKSDNSVTGLYDTLQHDNDNYQYIEITEQEYNGIKANWIVPDTQSQIDVLKGRLAATDYQIIKSYEYNLVGLEPPYDIGTLHAERQAIRDQINTLEGDET